MLHKSVSAHLRNWRLWPWTILSRMFAVKSAAGKTDSGSLRCRGKLSLLPRREIPSGKEGGQVCSQPGKEKATWLVGTVQVAESRTLGKEAWLSSALQGGHILLFGVLLVVVFIKPSVRRDEWIRQQLLLVRLIRGVRERYAHGKIHQKLKYIEMRALRETSLMDLLCFSCPVNKHAGSLLFWTTFQGCLYSK